MDHADRRAALSGGSPGVAVSLDLEAYDKRRAAMFTLLRVAAGVLPFGAWVPYSEAIGRSKSEKLELHLKVLYDLLRDVLVLHESGGAVRNEDLRAELESVANKVSFGWIRGPVKKVDDLAELIRRNIQKSIALDALIVECRTH
jgi:DNA polymerase-3 subunit delta'